MSSELSQNIAVTLEGWFVEHLSWRWIFSGMALVAPVMMLRVWFGIPREPTHRIVLGAADPWGMLFASAGYGLLYAGLDQGSRLNWTGFDLVTGLLAGGALLVAGFVVREAASRRPSINVCFLVQGNIPLLGTMLVLFRLVALSTAYLIPQRLVTVQGYCALDTGSVLLLIAVPQLVLAPVMGSLLRFLDERLLMGVGFALIGAACFMAARLTAAWATDDFLPSQVMQAIGQSLGLTSLVWFASRHLSPAEALTFDAFLQTIWLLGGEVGVAFKQTFVRVREQAHSFLLGLHMDAESAATAGRVSAYAPTGQARHPGCCRSAGPHGRTAGVVGGNPGRRACPSRRVPPARLGGGRLPATDGVAAPTACPAAHAVHDPHCPRRLICRAHGSV